MHAAQYIARSNMNGYRLGMRTCIRRTGRARCALSERGRLANVNNAPEHGSVLGGVVRFSSRVEVRGSYAALPPIQARQRVAPQRMIGAHIPRSFHPEI